MKKKFWMLAALLMTLTAFFACAFAEDSISTTVTMRVSKLTQDAIVNAGEDLSIEINVSGVEPARYQWYFEDEAIEGADQRVYNLVNADLEDAGVYRLDAFDESGKMLLSMDVSVRVVDDRVPKSGDDSRPVAAAAMGLIALAGFAAISLRRDRI